MGALGAGVVALIATTAVHFEAGPGCADARAFDAIVIPMNWTLSVSGDGKAWQLELKREGQRMMGRTLPAAESCDALAQAASFIVARFFRELAAGRVVVAPNVVVEPNVVVQEPAVVMREPSVVMREPSMVVMTPNVVAREPTVVAREAKAAKPREPDVAPVPPPPPPTVPPMVSVQQPSEPPPAPANVEPPRTSRPPPAKASAEAPRTSRPPPAKVSTEPPPGVSPNVVRVVEAPPRAPAAAADQQPSTPRGPIFRAVELAVGAGVQAEAATDVGAYFDAHASVKLGSRFRAGLFGGFAMPSAHAFTLGSNTRTITTQPFVGAAEGGACLNLPVELCGSIFAGVRGANGAASGPHTYRTADVVLVEPELGLLLHAQWVIWRGLFIRLELGAGAPLGSAAFNIQDGLGTGMNATVSFPAVDLTGSLLLGWSWQIL